MSERSGGALVARALLASAMLVAVFLALGGSSYAPAQVRDPCAERPWRSPEGLQEDIEQFTLSALDGAACELRVSRETLTLALGSEDGRRRFADDPRLEAAVRAGLLRAIDDAERADVLNPLLADGLREVAKRAPAEEVIGLIEDAAPIFDDLQGLFQGAQGLLPDEVGGLLP
ncbi:MAG: hypothetical protein AABM29_10000 [Actinomycetota bacterium]